MTDDDTKYVFGIGNKFDWPSIKGKTKLTNEEIMGILQPSQRVDVLHVITSTQVQHDSAVQLIDAWAGQYKINSVNIVDDKDKNQKIFRIQFDQASDCATVTMIVRLYANVTIA